MRNPIDINTLSQDEFAMYNMSKLKLDATVEKYYVLAKLPPFAYSSDGKPSDLGSEFIADIHNAVRDIDEEDFITDRYSPLRDVATKYKDQIAEASRIRQTEKTPALALKRWFNERGLEMDESSAWNLGV